MIHPPPRWLSALYRALLLWLPGSLRSGRADAMGATFDERYSSARVRGAPRAVALVVTELWDLMMTGFRLRVRWGARSAAGDEGGEMLSEMVQELRIALRTLARRPGFMALATLTLALGIGANTAMFSVVNSVVLRPLPYPDSEEIVRVWHTIPRLNWERGPFSYPNYAAIRDEATTLSGWGMLTGAEGTLLSEGPPMLVRGARVSGGLFPLLGIDAAIGRIIQHSDDDPAAPAVALLSHGLWTRAYGADPSVVGRPMRLDGASPTIVGVMPAGFTGPSGAHEYWLPISLDAEGQARDVNYLQVLARLSPGATVPAARAEVAGVLERVTRENPDDRERGAFVETLHESVVGDVKAQLYLLFGAVALVLLAACANVAGLTLARTTTRHREHALRLALGAGRGRLVRHLLTESAVVAAAGGIVGVAVAYGITRAIVGFAPADLPRRAEIGVDPGALLFLLAVASGCVFVFGLLPALRGAETPAGDALRERGGASVGTRGRAQRALAGFQIALALVLTVGGGLLGKSLVRLQSVEMGFDPDGVLVATLPLRFEENVERVAFVDQTLARIGALPGVQAAGLSWSVPFGRAWGSTRVAAEGSDLPLDDRPNAHMVPFRGEMFAALGLRFLEGSHTLEAVAPEDPLEVVVNETFARTLWPEGGAVGKRFQRGRDADAPWNTVVGVVADAKTTSLAEPAPLIMYQPLTQAGWIQDGQLVVRTGDADPLGLVGSVRSIVAEWDPAMAVDQVATMQSRVSQSVQAPRFRAWLLGGFALLVTLLAVVGVYGVMGLLVAARVRDIGVRMALGAGRPTVLLEVLRSGAGFTAAGVVVGVLGALALSRTLDALLFGVDARDPATYVSAALVLTVATAVAMLIPARRAATVQPMDVLRDD